MQPGEFLQAVKMQLGGTIVEEVQLERVGMAPGYFQPHIDLIFRDRHVKLDFIIQDELHFVIYQLPPRVALVRSWNFFERMLSWLGLQGGVRTGDPGFDRRFLTQYLSAENMGGILSPRVRDLIQNLFPFVEFEMTPKIFRLLKGVDIQGTYSPEAAVSDLDRLMCIVEEICGKVQTDEPSKP